MYQVLSIKYKKLLLLVVLTTYYLLLTTSPLAFGQTMRNANYIIYMGNLNSAAGKPTGPDYKVNLTVGQTAPPMIAALTMDGSRPARSA